MKTIFLKIAAMAVLVVFVATSCGSKKQTAVSNSRNSSNPFGGAFEAPCAMYDDDEYFAATGIASGPATQKGTLQRTALSNGQAMIRQKMQHAYEGVVKDYFEHIGANKGSDVETQTIGGGNQIIMGIVNNTSQSCLMFSPVDDKGNVECYIGIKISKSKVANAIADNLSKSEKAEIRQHAEDFRKQIAEDLKNYKSE
ncbi:MAG: hypothetical protein LBN11_00090 [Tannerella sp.]|nr:hypothetical protein [Tannerella sp.]